MALTPLDFGAIGDKMRVSELSEYQEKSEKTGIKVGDYVIRGVGAYKNIIANVGPDHYAAINLNTGLTWKHEAIFPGAEGRNFTKSELELILGDLDDWEVVE